MNNDMTKLKDRRVKNFKKVILDDHQEGGFNQSIDVGDASAVNAEAKMVARAFAEDMVLNGKS